MSGNVPLHILTQEQTKAWFLFPAARPMIASHLGKKYRCGCGVLAFTWTWLYLIAYVSPDGNLRELQRPFRSYSHSHPDITNKAPSPECECQNWIDPEVQGPWRERGTGTHHPMCQFKPTAVRVYGHIIEARRRGEQVRPDEMLREEQRAEGIRNTKTRMVQVL